MEKHRETKGRRRARVNRIIFWAVLISFAAPIGFLIMRLASLGEDGVGPDGRTYADYSLMLLQCLLGIAAMFLPSFLAKKLQIRIPSNFYMVFVVFLYCAIFLGEVGNFFYRIPFWDLILHCFSGVMLGSFGFLVVSILNRDEHVNMKLTPAFVAVFAFCFAVTLGVLWELYEYFFDGLLGLNMQKFRLEDGTILIGRDALRDTMEDFIVDCLGALAATIAGYLTLKKRRAQGAEEENDED